MDLNKNHIVYEGGKAYIPFPVVFPIKCACEATVIEASFKRDIIRHQKNCKRTTDNAQITEVLFRCQLCGTVSADRRKATTHQATHFGDPNLHFDDYPCPTCNRRFGTQKALLSHTRKFSTQGNIPPHSSILQAIENIRNEVDQERPNSNTTTEEPHCNPTIEEASPLELTGDLSQSNSTGETSLSEYPLRSSSFEPNQWLNDLLPPKLRKVPNPEKPNIKMDRNTLQALYSKSSKKGMNAIHGSKQIECQVPAAQLEVQMSAQFQQKTMISGSFEIEWPTCELGKDELAAEFTIDEVTQAMKHADSAPGPDRWTYSQISKVANFPQRFLSGIHKICATFQILRAWKSCDSLLLFKKPNKYHKGEESVLKNFRPIALSNVSYKTFTSMLSNRLTKWLKANEGIAWSQRAVFNRNGVRDNALIVNSAIQSKKTVIFFDLSDAFNSVCHELLFTGLRSSGCPEWIVRTIEQLYADCETTPSQ